jgi:DNA (cytosine-5)-methyltransferase 1
MYIQTESAWYLLEEPSELYCKTFARFWIPHRLSQVIADYALKHPDKTYEQFSNSLGIISDESSKMVGRAITVEDVSFWVCLYSYSRIQYALILLTTAGCHSG